MIAQVPNLLTLLRIALCPVFVLVLNAGNYQVAVVLFVLAGITDGLDGYIAKRYDCESKLGAILDPIADKLLISSAYVMLGFIGDIPFYLLVVVIFRDLSIIIGYFVLISLIGEKMQISPIYSSKVNTFLQITLVGFVLVEQAGWLTIPYAVDVLVLSVLVSSVFSGLQYLWYWGFKRDLTSEG